MKLLHLDCSASGEKSVSRELTAFIVKHLEGRYTQISYRDLDADPISHLTNAVLTGQADDPRSNGEAILAQFLEADILVLGAPMYNFTIPTPLRAWIDRIVIAGKTFRYTATGPEGLAGGKKVFIASSRGGAHGDNSPVDFQEAYLRQIFQFMGVDDITVIRAEGVGLSPEAREAAIAVAKAEVLSRLSETKARVSV